MWNKEGNCCHALTPTDGDTAEDLRDDIMLLVNEACGTGALTC
jgi:hypothetical protein